MSRHISNPLGSIVKLLLGIFVIWVVISTACEAMNGATKPIVDVLSQPVE